MTILLPPFEADGPAAARPVAGGDDALARLRARDDALYVAAETAARAAGTVTPPADEGTVLPPLPPPTQAARDLVERRLRSVQDRRAPADALAVEARRNQTQLLDAEAAAGALEAAVGNDPSFLEDALPLAADLSRSLYPLTGEAAARAFDRDTRARLGRRAARRMMEQDPEGARDALRSGPLARTIPGAEREKMITAAQRCATSRKADDARLRDAAVEAETLDHHRAALGFAAGYRDAIRDGAADEETLVMAEEDGVIPAPMTVRLRDEREKAAHERQRKITSARSAAARLEQGRPLDGGSDNDRAAAEDHAAVILPPGLNEMPPAARIGALAAHARATGILTGSVRDRLLVLAATGDPADRVLAASALRQALQQDPKAGAGLADEVWETLTAIDALARNGAAAETIFPLVGEDARAALHRAAIGHGLPSETEIWAEGDVFDPPVPDGVAPEDWAKFLERLRRDTAPRLAGGTLRRGAADIARGFDRYREKGSEDEKALGELVLSVTPGIGEVLSGNEAAQAYRLALAAHENDDLAEALRQGSFALIAGIGAVPGIGILARLPVAVIRAASILMKNTERGIAVARGTARKRVAGDPKLGDFDGAKAPKKRLLPTEVAEIERNRAEITKIDKQIADHESLQKRRHNFPDDPREAKELAELKKRKLALRLNISNISGIGYERNVENFLISKGFRVTSTKIRETQDGMHRYYDVRSKDGDFVIEVKSGNADRTVHQVKFDDSFLRNNDIELGVIRENFGISVMPGDHAD